jgi:hypothetical protein
LTVICDVPSPRQTCVRCDEPFPPRSRPSGRKRLYCSNRCRAGQTPAKFLIGRACVACSAPLPPDRLDGTKYCGAECRHSQNRIAAKSRYEHVCEVCGATFKTHARMIRCCSLRCGAALAGRARSDRYAAGHKRICQHCGKDFIQKPGYRSAKQIASGQPQKYCSTACSATSKRIYSSPQEARWAERDRSRVSRGLPPLGKPSVVPCAICSTPFQQKTCRGKTCSRVCSRELSKQTARDAAKPAAPLPERECKRCGKAFTQTKAGRPQVFCGRKCRRRHFKRCEGSENHRKRARRANVSYEPVSRLKVFERDRWKCQICGRKTPKRVMGSCVDSAPELDHRVPMAMGGGHTWDNVQCACRACNSKKGGTIVVGQLSLFARPPDVPVYLGA